MSDQIAKIMDSDASHIERALERLASEHRIAMLGSGGFAARREIATHMSRLDAEPLSEPRRETRPRFTYIRLYTFD